MQEAGEAAHRARADSDVENYEKSQSLMSASDIYNNALVKDITIDWVYNPHTLTLLGVLTMLMMTGAILWESDSQYVRCIICFCVHLFAALGWITLCKA